MTNPNVLQDNKQAELLKYRDLVLATIDYHIEDKSIQIKTADFDSDEHFRGLKNQTEEHFHKGRLSKLKQWFRDLTEGQIEARNLKFNEYLKQKTHYDVDVFANYFERIDKIIAKGKITTDNQFYDMTIFLDQLCQEEPIDKNKIELLNQLIFNYER
jgi:hypothetical protein